MISRPFQYALLFAVPAILLLLAGFDYLGETARKIVFLPGWLVVDDLISGYSVNSFEAASLGRICVSWFFWVGISWAVTLLVAKKRGHASIVLTILIVGFGWLCFRTTAFDGYAFYRSWGFITRATADSNGDGQIDVESWFSWREPFMDAHSPALRTRMDQNYDGDWDTWVDYETNTLRIDTNGDGAGDVNLEPSYEGYEHARELRGYGW